MTPLLKNSCLKYIANFHFIKIFLTEIFNRRWNIYQDKFNIWQMFKLVIHSRIHFLCSFNYKIISWSVTHEVRNDETQERIRNPFISFQLRFKTKRILPLKFCFVYNVTSNSTKCLVNHMNETKPAPNQKIINK